MTANPPAVPRVVVGVNHDLDPGVQAGVIRPAQVVGLGQPAPVDLAHADPLQSQERTLQHPSDLRQDRTEHRAGPDRDDHQRHLGVRGEEACPLAHSVGGPVDAQENRRAQALVAPEQVDDGHERRPVAHALMSPAVDRELRRLMDAFR